MFRVLPAISGALAVLAVAVVLFLWFGDRGRGPEAVVLMLPEMVKEAAEPGETAVSGLDHASTKQNGDENRADNDRTVSEGMARLRAPAESAPDDLEDLTTTAGEIGDAESFPSKSAEDFTGENDVNAGDASSQSVNVAAAAASSEDETGQSSGAVEQPAANVGPPPQTVPRHGRLAWFEIGVMNRRSNLRENPDVDSPVVAKLARGARVQVLEAEPVFGYYRVVSGGQEGWVWWLNVEPRNTGDVQG